MPVAPEARSAFLGNRLEMSPGKYVHSRSTAPDPVMVFLGTYFKEVTQRAKDD